MSILSHENVHGYNSLHSNPGQASMTTMGLALLLTNMSGIVGYVSLNYLRFQSCIFRDGHQRAHWVPSILVRLKEGQMLKPQAIFSSFHFLLEGRVLWVDMECCWQGHEWIYGTLFGVSTRICVHLCTKQEATCKNAASLYSGNKEALPVLWTCS